MGRDLSQKTWEREQARYRLAKELDASLKAVNPNLMFGVIDSKGYLAHNRKDETPSPENKITKYVYDTSAKRAAVKALKTLNY